MSIDDGCGFLSSGEENEAAVIKDDSRDDG